MIETHPVQRLKNLFHLFQSYKANRKYGFPGKELKIIAVTGTDGKTTTTSMIYHILKESGLKVGFISTISAKIGEEELDTGLHVTTPEPWDVPKYLRMMVDAGVEYLVLESTSSGLQQNRLWSLKFDSSTITNIKVDHLDYHGTWENYARAKYKVVEMLKPGGLAVLNNDDSDSADWIKKQDVRTDIKYKWYSKSDVKELEMSVEGIKFKLNSQVYKIPVIGEYNIENSLAAINICLRYLKPEQIAEAIDSFPTPKGRMQVIQTEPFTIIIDFAHTGSSLKRALSAVNEIKQEGNKIISVFGCAGKRDKSRRSMGEVSASLADITVLTAEDPRDEKLKDVNDDILDYASKHGGVLIKRFADTQEYSKNLKNIHKFQQEIEEIINKQDKPFFAFDEDSINSRQDAIDFALKLAKQGEIVFITGKAHEQSLAFGADEVEYPWSDHEAVKRALDQSK